MFASAFITFRETIEAALVIGIILTFLAKTNQRVFNRYVWQGAGLGVLLSLSLAFILERFFSGLEGKTAIVFEGIMMFIAAGLITWMIMWVHKQKDVAKKIKQKITHHIEEGYGMGIVTLVATCVLREGTETVLYLKASSMSGQSDQLMGAIIGIVTALILAYALFRYALRVNLALVFNVTSIFLILFAAGLVSHGIHEFQEVRVLPIFSFDPVFNITHILDQASVFGSLLQTLFGYTSKPTLLEIFSYGTYLLFIVQLQRITDKALKSAK